MREELKLLESYITVSQGMSGWHAVHVGVFDNGDMDILQTGFGRFPYKNQAGSEAKEWAEADKIEFRP